MKTWLIVGLIALGFGIVAGGWTWAAASAAQRQLPTRSVAYCAQHGGASLECVLNGEAYLSGD